LDGGVGGDGWSGYCLHHGRRTGNCNHQHWTFRLALQGLVKNLEQRSARGGGGGEGASDVRVRFLYDPTCQCDRTFEKLRKSLHDNPDGSSSGGGGRGEFQKRNRRGSSASSGGESSKGVHNGFRKRRRTLLGHQEEGGASPSPLLTRTAKAGPYNETYCFEALVATGFRSHGGRADGGDAMTLFGRTHAVSAKLRKEVLSELRATSHNLFVANRVNGGGDSGGAASSSTPLSEMLFPSLLPATTKDDNGDDDEETAGASLGIKRTKKSSALEKKKAKLKKKRRGGGTDGVFKVLIYTRRDATHGRQLANPDAVKKQMSAWCAAQGLPCELRVLGHWPVESFKAQVQLMAETALFITPHGSALENILFMRQGAAVIEVSARLTWVGSALHGNMAEALEVQHCLASPMLLAVQALPPALAQSKRHVEKATQAAAVAAGGGCGVGDDHCTLGPSELAACLARFRFPTPSAAATAKAAAAAGDATITT